MCTYSAGSGLHTGPLWQMHVHLVPTSHPRPTSNQPQLWGCFCAGSGSPRAVRGPCLERAAHLSTFCPRIFSQVVGAFETHMQTRSAHPQRQSSSSGGRGLRFQRTILGVFIH